LCESDIFDTIFNGTILSGADFNQANLGWAIFGDNDLSQAEGLTNTRHYGPSTVGVDTLYKSHGRIPDSFLRNCGVPEPFIIYLQSLIGAELTVQFHSCFISYSHRDAEFVKYLHSRLREAHIRVWFAPEDMRGGEKLHEQIESAIQIHDRLLLVLSENSMQSEWVMTEIRNARRIEIEERRRKLFPIRLVDFETIKAWKCFDSESGKDLAIEAREFFIPDFSNWKDRDAFEVTFNQLLRDLKAEENNNAAPNNSFNPTPR
jgi:TIR domain